MFYADNTGCAAGVELLQLPTQISISFPSIYVDYALGTAEVLPQ
jgi:hypothetical protein